MGYFITTIATDCCGSAHWTNKLTPQSTNDTKINILGRWTSVLLQGKGQIRTRIVSIYALHKKGGPLSAIVQHQLYYLAQQNCDDPYNLFWRELTEQLVQWKEEGEQLILGGNWNLNITDYRIKRLQTQLTLKIPHNKLHTKSPCTRYPGSNTIDFFLTTAGLHITKSGYTRAGGRIAKIIAVNG